MYAISASQIRTAAYRSQGVDFADKSIDNCCVLIFVLFKLSLELRV